MPDSVEGHFKEAASLEELERFAGMLSTLYPSLKRVSFIRIWTGVMGMTPDRLPYIGPVPGFENYFINTGYSNGLAYCPIGGKLSSEYILNKGNTSISLDLVNPERFYGKQFELPKQYNYELLDSIIGEWDL
jgi:glycine/D-amino acid oxidase-like deaminating enzyme